MEVRKSGFLQIIPLLIIISVLTFPAYAQYGGGTGEPNEPYLIYTAEQMNKIGLHEEDWDKHFKLKADIDLDLYRGTDFNIIGYFHNQDNYKYFTGVFDGNGHTILNFTYSSPYKQNVGIFMDIRGHNAEIMNLGLIDPNVYAENGQGIASLVSFIGNGATIRNCFVQGGYVSGKNYVGGLVGGNENGYIVNCYASTVVDGNDYVGGLAGYNFGDIEHAIEPFSTIINCYSAGRVSGNKHVGGLVGDNQGEVFNSFWDIERSGVQISEGVTGLTTEQMMDAEVYSLNGWGGDPNWVLDNGNDYPRLAWEGTAGQNIGEPIIDWFEGHGTTEDPYIIDSTEKLSLIGNASFLWDKHFVLICDLDFSDVNIPHMLIQPGIYFNGSFNGNGHVIHNLKIDSEGMSWSYLGLFSRIGPEGWVYNLGLENVVVIGGYNSHHIGALAGFINSGIFNAGSVYSCYTTGSISGSKNSALLGGLVGVNYGIINNCYTTTTVSSVDNSRYLGGLAGRNRGRIDSCYSIGRISGFEKVGGLVGENNGGVINSFWDTQTSGQETSAGGTGLNTAERQMGDTFLDAGWDFIDETENGTEDIWWIDEGQGYPRLWWEDSK